MTKKLDPRIKRCLPVLRNKAMTRGQLSEAIEVLEAAGYVIVHRDDVPGPSSDSRSWDYPTPDWVEGRIARRKY